MLMHVLQELLCLFYRVHIGEELQISVGEWYERGGGRDRARASNISSVVRALGGIKSQHYRKEMRVV